MRTNYIKKFWNGDVPLWKSFWLVVVLLDVMLVLGMEGISPTECCLRDETLAGFFNTIYSRGGFFAIVGTVLFGGGYAIVSNVGIWRSANKYQGKRIFAIAAKGFVVLNVSSMVVNILLAVFLILYQFDFL